MSVTVDTLIALAPHYWGALQRAGASRATADVQLRALAAIESPALRAMLYGPDGQATALLLPQWYEYGFPRVELSHTYAAALLATNVSAEAMSLVRPAFPATLIDVPSGLLYVDEEDGRRAEVRYVLVGQYEQPGRGLVWSYVVFTDGHLSLWKAGVRTADLTEAMKDYRDDPFGVDLTDSDKRVSTLIGRLIINVFLAMSDPERSREHNPARHERWRSRRAAGRAPLPTTRVFRVGSPIRHDFRAAVREYAAGRRGKLDTQHVVAGHYKQQPCGPRGGDRKLVWIEPYYRGPEDAPILVRQHQLRGDVA